MLALIASLMLGLYVLLPVLVFDKALGFFVPVKKINRARTEEVAFGALVVFAPLILTFALSHCSWTVGHYPFPLNESAEQSKGADYKSAVMALQNDHYWEANQQNVWNSVEHIKWRQARFLFWMYLLLTLECGIVILLLRKYGAWRKHAWYRRLSGPLLKRVSPWHILFTTFTFDPKQPREVHVDVVSSGELFTGLVGPEHYLVNPDGSLNGLLLTQTKRYKRKQLEEDRKQQIVKDKNEYWSPVAGDGQFYIPSGTISNVNIRFRVSKKQLESELTASLNENEEIKKALPAGGSARFEITFTQNASPTLELNPQTASGNESVDPKDL